MENKQTSFDCEQIIVLWEKSHDLVQRIYTDTEMIRWMTRNKCLANRTHYNKTDEILMHQLSLFDLVQWRITKRCFLLAFNLNKQNMPLACIQFKASIFHGLQFQITPFFYMLTFFFLRLIRLLAHECCIFTTLVTHTHANLMARKKNVNAKIQKCGST